MPQHKKTLARPVARPETSLEKPLRYTVARNPKALMRLAYENGSLPYSGKEPVQDYLVRNGAALVREQGEAGVVKLLSAHPDKDLTLEHFGKQAAAPTTLEDRPHVIEAITSNFTGEPQPQLLGTLPKPTEKSVIPAYVWVIAVILVILFILD